MNNRYRHASCFMLTLLLMAASVEHAAAQGGIGIGPEINYRGTKNSYVGINAGAAYINAYGRCNLHYEAYGLTAGVDLHPGENLVLSPNVGLFASYGILTAGVALGYYTDLHEQESLWLKPEIGISVLILRVVYGFNVRLTDDRMRGINEHELGIRLFIPVEMIPLEKKSDSK